MLGALALIRGEWIPVLQHQKRRAAWIGNVLATAMYVLALDRFGDFSGAMFHENHPSADPSVDAPGPPASTILASSVVAPVREVAGQVVAAAWIRSSPAAVRPRVVRLLLDMSREVEEWEIRHGSLTAFKYMMALVLSNRETNESLEQKASVALMVDAAAAALHDESDDVKSVAAELLHQHYEHVQPEVYGDLLDSSSATETVVQGLWKALLCAQSHSSCLVNLVDLLQLFAQSDCRGFLRRIDLGRSDLSSTPSAVGLAQTLARLLDSDFTSVRVAVFHCVKVLALPLAEQCAAANICDAHLLLLNRIFDLFWDVPADDPSQENGSHALRDPNGNILEIARSEAWEALATCTGRALARSDGSQSTTFIYSLLRRYFTTQIPDRSRFPFQAYEAASRALSVLLLSIGLADNGAMIPSILELSIFSFLRSPWSAQCEAACLLVSSLFRLSEPSPTSRLSYRAQHVAFTRRIAELLWSLASGSVPLFCLVVEPYLSSLSSSLDFAELIQLCDDAFDKVANRLFRISNDKSVAELSDMIVEVWHRAFEARTGDLVRPARREVSVTGMRVWSTIAGATVKVMSLPKVTPIARALITALKNETSHPRLEWTGDSVCCLLLALDCDSRFAKAQGKILDTICTMADSEISIETTTYLPGSQALTTYIRHTLATKALVEIGPVWSRISQLLDTKRNQELDCLIPCARFLYNVSEGLKACNASSYTQIDAVIDRFAGMAIETESDELRGVAAATIRALCSIDETRMLSVVLRRIIHYLNDSYPVSFRTNASQLLESTVAASGESLCPFVKALLPTVLSLMTDSCETCSRFANKTFASLVRLSPLIQAHKPIRLTQDTSSGVDAIIDHLVLGKPLPPVTLPEVIQMCLSNAGVSLRAYQKEGVSWLRFLQKLNLNGALCDSMGLGTSQGCCQLSFSIDYLTQIVVCVPEGKTLQALIAMALCHCDDTKGDEAPLSLIVCPSTLVGHWMAEIAKFFPGRGVFRPLCYMGSKSQRESLRHSMKSSINVVVTSYAVLRNDDDFLTKHRYRLCALDEGHLLKNHMTGASPPSRLRS
jgi:SNF2-related domain